MAPITRRRKRVIDSDDEGDDVTDASHFADTSMLKTRSATSTSGLSKNGSRLNKKNMADSSWSSNPSHSHVQKKPKVEDKSLSGGDLISIFSRQAQNQKASQAAKISLAQRPRNIPSADDITDLISDDDDGINATSASLVGQRAQKRSQTTTVTKSTRTSIPTPTPSLVSSQSSQLFPASGSKPRNMFLRPSAPSVVAKKADHDDIRPWSEQFGPTTLDELAVHKKKVSDVRRWLSDVLGGLTRQRILLLKGAAGTGKTTTVKLLAQSLGFEILEWKNPTGGLFGSTLSASRQFESFIGVGGTFGTLDTDASEAIPSKLDAFNYDDKTRRIILIEEFPNTYTRSSTVLASFRNALVEFLTSNVPTLAMFANKRVKQPIVPIVMIVSETLLTTTSASADSFTAHRLLGPDILRHPGATVIEFNAIAPSILTKALELVVLKEARKSGRKRTPGPLVLKRLGEIGDIRSAISSLEFLCLKGDQEGDWGSRVLFSKPKKAMRNVSLTRAEEATLEQISQRESSLGIFHAVAKVVYNKREEDGLHDNPAERLPPFLARHSRPKASLVNVETLIDEIGTDTSTFVSALHENYPLSCEQASYSEDLPTSIDHVNACIDALSDSDLLCPSWDVFFGGRGSYLGLSNRDTGSYILRQDEMAFQVAVRGLLHGLPCPVKRQQHPSRGSSDAFKMFYPTSIKLWRTREEIEGLLDDWSSKLLQSDKYMPQHNVTAGADIFRRGNAEIPRKTAPSTDQQSTSPHSGEPAPLLSLGDAGRKEMVLERLPAMAAILRGKKNNPAHSVSMSALRLKDIEKVVSFYGISGQSEEVLGENDEDLGVEDAGEQWATDNPTDEVLPRKKRTAIKQKDSATRLETENMPLVEKLVLSDDDIED
ncbi:RFC checkpoint protein Rad17 [Ceratocystis pirilliformis]|uniref:RFC checkpoint protein Rad17 n=1 Tax=Ceratocystis pirilliformis TaxID=259994 RepID=A0ABR3ZFT9_9PEZI